MRAVASRSGGPQACPAGCARHILKPLFRTLRCIPNSDCFTTPAAGFRGRVNGALESVGVNGEYFSSSPFMAGHYYGGILYFTARTVYPLCSSAGARSVARAVRCVQHLRKLPPGRTHRMLARPNEQRRIPKTFQSSGFSVRLVRLMRMGISPRSCYTKIIGIL